MVRVEVDLPTAKRARNDAVENRAASIGRVRPLTMSNNAATNVMEQQDCGTMRIPNGENQHSRPGYSDQIRCYPPPASLIARKFSLLWPSGNSVGKRLNFLPKAKGALAISSPKSANFPVFSPGTGNKRAETGSLMTASSAS